MSEWIKVSERLPKDGQNVLVLLRGETHCVGIFCAAHGFGCDVTHWMPLPEPPKRESSFEQWWQAQPNGVDDDGPSKKRIGTQFCWVEILRPFAKFIWDAAVAAAKSPDFVP